jgi:hypothetical protein
MTAHERAVKLLKENRSILDNMSRVLVEKETIYTEEVNMLMKGASYKEVVEFMDAQDGSRRINPFEAMTKSTKATSEHVVEGYGEPVKAETETADASGDAEKPEDNSEE